MPQDSTPQLPLSKNRETAHAENASHGSRLRETLFAGEALRRAYREQRTLLGTFLIELGCQRTVRALALAGFDFVVIDLEHSPFGIETAHALIAEAGAVGLPSIVRVWMDDEGLIGKVLDAGAGGVLVPRVNSVASAKRVVEAARYRPHGARGMAPLMSYGGTGMTQAAYGDNAVVMVQIESGAAIKDAAQIMAIPGLDGVFIGPYDLSQAIGVAGDVNSEAVRSAACDIAAAAPADTMLAVYVDRPDWSGEWANRGFRLQCVEFDGRMLLNAARNVLDTARGSHA